jgi:hypothetical protein
MFAASVSTQSWSNLNSILRAWNNRDVDFINFLSDQKRNPKGEASHARGRENFKPFVLALPEKRAVRRDLRLEKAEKEKKNGKLNNSDSAGMRAEKQFINIA